MKNTNKCPKCGSEEVVLVKGTKDRYDIGNNISLGGVLVMVDKYVCCDCGYCEEWIDKKDAKYVKMKYENKIK